MQFPLFKNPAQIVLCGILRSFSNGAYQHVVSAIKVSPTIFCPKPLRIIRDSIIIPVSSVTILYADSDTFELRVFGDFTVIKFACDNFTRSVVGHLLDVWGEIGATSDAPVLRRLLEFTSSVLDSLIHVDVPAAPIALPARTHVEIDGAAYNPLDPVGTTVTRANLAAFLALWKEHSSTRGRITAGIIDFLNKYDSARLRGCYYDSAAIDGMEIPLQTRDPHGVAASDLNLCCEIIFVLKFGDKPWKVAGFGPECAAVCAELCPLVETGEFY